MKKQKKLINDEKDELEENLNLKDDLIEENEGDASKENNNQYEQDSTTDYKNIQSIVTYENEEYLYSTKLNNKIDYIFQSSRWTVINPSKKIPKDLIPLIFQDILEQLEGTEFSMVEKFVGICDYAGINYQKAYESIHMKYKELIVQEMDNKYGILGKKGIKKIF